MPPGFDFPNEHELWLPFRADSTRGRQNRSWLAIGLLRQGHTLDDGRSELRGIASRLAALYPDTNREWSVDLLPMRDYFVSAADEGTMLAAVSLLLLAACANIGGLVVARGVSRQRELAVRAALGAGRLRLIRWLVSETALIAVVGGAFGLLVARWGIRALVAWVPESPPYWATPALDLRVAAVAMAATAGVALLAGFVPASRLSRVTAVAALSSGARTAGGSASHRRLQHLFVVGQVAVSFSLVVGALLLGRSATALLVADAGFDHRPLLSARFYIAGDEYDPIAARVGLVNDVVSRVSTLPGVAAVAATGAIPTDDGGSDIRLSTPSGPSGAFDEVGAQLVPVTSGFWDTLGLPLDEGRAFIASESSNPESDAVVVNRRLAQAFWPNQSALGRTLRVIDGDAPVTMRVVGVAPDVVYEEFGETTAQSQLNVYVPYARVGWRTQALLIRVDGPDPGAAATGVRAAIREIDPGLAVYDVLTMVDRRQYNHWGNQFVGRTMAVFAFAALLLACVGTYGITAHGVAARRREIGVRMAIGATSRDIRWLFLGSGARLALAGLAVGLPVALLSARALEGALFNVSPWEGPVWVALPALLLVAILAATYLPAHRASALDPAKTLRE
jgi:putative ABC transport system permease protein